MNISTYIINRVGRVIALLRGYLKASGKYGNQSLKRLCLNESPAMVRSHIFLLIVFLSYHLYESFAERRESGQSVCLLHDPPNQCGEFCLTALKPMLDHIAFHQKEWSTCDQQKLNETQEKINRIEEQQKVLLDNLSKLDKSLEQKETKIDRIEKLFEALQEKFDKKSVSSLFQRIGSRLIYIEYKVHQSWHGAEERCRQIGGHLATIQNDYDFNAINSKLERGNSYWLGVSDISMTGEFLSVVSGKRAPFFKWRQGEPNNVEDKNNCVDIYNGNMFDTNCDVEQKYICEADG
ncbi:accessory gland protein Acp29AB-like [Drosophila eugracilis]|uniref:accessory gland protein Acp29AB-like n=1 Tax=Drosophila eugracilis TaxID=29029 RepID=UPI0007E736E5|nr:accessory gland protein Acp29AB-like [Drosophila eugracilis]